MRAAPRATSSRGGSRRDHLRVTGEMIWCQPTFNPLIVALTMVAISSRSAATGTAISFAPARGLSHDPADVFVLAVPVMLADPASETALALVRRLLALTPEKA